MRQSFVQNGAQKYNGERSSLSGWFGTPQGAYVLGWELAQFDSAVDDVFGYRAVQVGLPEVDFLRQNRIPFRASVALEPGAAIVFISSAASLRAATGIPAYDASKAALLGICRQVAREGMARGIRANLVVPSLVDTPLGREASRLNPDRTARRLPFGRQATAWEVAYATVWLLSGESSYVNAHPLVLDGGATSFG